MNRDTAQDVQRLAALRASGALTQEQYDRLTQALVQSAQAPTASSSPQPAPPQGPSLLRVALAAGGGAVAGSLAADMLRGALADPPPEVVSANFVESTTFTGDGYVTHGDVTFEDADGNVIADGSYTEEGTWDSPDADQGAIQQPDVIESDWDAGGVDFGAF